MIYIQWLLLNSVVVSEFGTKYCTGFSSQFDQSFYIKNIHLIIASPE